MFIIIEVFTNSSYTACFYAAEINGGCQDIPVKNAKHTAKFIADLFLPNLYKGFSTIS